ncbi:cyclin-like protein [Wilcoxina mikolae CBS 423.85]|nr:cyclin-like protein [Wilcoxina mikolae CBS 423.85]
MTPSSHTATPFSPSSNPTTVEAYSFSNTYIQRSRPYLTTAQIDTLRPSDEARTIQTRLAACQWIVQISRVLQFPVRTVATAMILYHRLLLFNKTPYFQETPTDPSVAALFVACKIEDTLKKSREILAASYNLRHPNAEPINPDSALLEETTKRVIGMERTILETSSFDFRNRHAQPFLIKFCRLYEVGSRLAHRAWEVSVDVYRTLSPLRSTPHALALASLETACRLENYPIRIMYEDLEASRDDVLSIIDDLLELYTNYSTQTTVGPKYQGTAYLNARIELNRERKRLANGHGHARTPISLQLQNMSDRGNSGTIRFMIDPERESKECGMLDGAADGGMGTAKVVKCVLTPTSPWSQR